MKRAVRLQQASKTLKKRLMVLVLSVMVLVEVAAGCTSAMAGKTTAEPGPGAAGESGAKVAGIEVIIDGSYPPEKKSAYSYLARQLIRLRAGDVLSKKAVQDSLDALRLSNRFSAIHVDSTTSKTGETLVYNLTPSRIIADIDITGRYPLFENQILNQLTIYPGNPYTEKELSDQTGAVARLYKREGYIDPRVSVEVERTLQDHQDIIDVDIHKGEHYVLEGLTFTGNDHISATALKLRMSVWRSNLIPRFGRFSEFYLKKDIKNLTDYYHSRGYADALVSYQLDHPQDPRKVHVEVRISEGPHYTVTFMGNHEFWNLTLKKDVVLFDRGNRNNTGIRKSVQNIKKRYREDGYLETKVKADDCPGEKAGPENHPICFVIDEGPQTIVDKVAINGNKNIPDDEISDEILTRPPSLLHDGAYVPETLESDVYAVKTLYLKKGFTERTVDSKVALTKDKTGADVDFNIVEGPQTRVHSVVIKGLKGVTDKVARKVLVHHPGDPFRASASEVEKEAIVSLVSEQGYPHAAAAADISYNKDHTEADIVYTVTAGPRVTLGNIFISGNLRTKEKVIRQELEEKPGSPLSLQALYDAQRRLRDMEIFHGVSYRTFGLKEKNDTVDLLVEVEENKPYFMQGGVGYESDTGFYGRIKAGDRNLFGLNKELWAAGEVSETGYRLETQLTEPRFFGTRTSATLGVYAEEVTEFNQPFGTRTLGGSLGFNHLWGKHLTTALTFSLERRTQFSVDQQSGQQTLEAPRTVFVTSPYITYDSRDSFVRPTRGLLSYLQVDLSKGVDDQLDDFVRYDFDTRYYYSPLKRLTLAGRARVGQVISYADNQIVPDDQLFYLGGIQSVRGFAENLLRFDDNGDPVGGKTAIVGSLEARIDLGWNLELATFYDVGSVQNAQSDGGSDSFRSSVGVGLRYITPIGPIGLLYGHKLDPLEGESSGQFNFSIGYSF